MSVAQRIFATSQFLTPSEGEPLRTVISLTNDAAVVAWHVKPGQSIPAHFHPTGQDTWTILSGEGNYFLDGNDSIAKIKSGDVVVARTGEVHGVRCTGSIALEFVSVVSPSDAGYHKIQADPS
ncbi:MAG: cupin domain-containing protein [Fibrobacterota bacterium]